MGKLWFLYVIMIGLDGNVAKAPSTPLGSAESEINCTTAGDIVAAHFEKVSDNNLIVKYTCVELDASVDELIK